MKNFKEYKLKNLQLIFGGELIPTCPDGYSDVYDTEKRRVIYTD